MWLFKPINSNNSVYFFLAQKFETTKLWLLKSNQLWQKRFLRNLNDLMYNFLKLLLLFFFFLISDVNECLTNPCKCSQKQNCKATCKDTPGSFTCSCNTGFKLAADGKTCQGKKISHYRFYIHNAAIFFRLFF